MMKKSLITLVILILGVFLVQQAVACEIKFKVLSGEKEVYAIGDEMVVAVKVIYTHKNCPEGITATKFNFTGTKTNGATKWKQTGDGIFERKFKIEITEEKKNRHLLNAVRTCDKDGGAGTIKFKVE